MSATKNIALTVFGQFITGVSFAVGESVVFTFTCEDPSARTALDLTGWTLKASLCAPDLRGDPKLPAVIEKSCTITNAVAGLATWALAPADTQPNSAPLTPGYYFVGLSAFDGAGGAMQLANIVVNITANPTLS